MKLEIADQEIEKAILGALTSKGRAYHQSPIDEAAEQIIRTCAPALLVKVKAGVEMLFDSDDFATRLASAIAEAFLAGAAAKAHQAGRASLTREQARAAAVASLFEKREVSDG